MVYVDDMKAPLGRMLMSHMLADTAAELHAMADRIGVARCHYQGDHYDICQAKKALAICFGAVAVTAPPGRAPSQQAQGSPVILVGGTWDGRQVPKHMLEHGPRVALHRLRSMHGVPSSPVPATVPDDREVYTLREITTLCGDSLVVYAIEEMSDDALLVELRKRWMLVV